MDTNNTKDREIVITRTINAPRELVWKAWTEPDHLIKWWGPNGFTNTFHEIEIKPGGVWRFTMHGPDKVDYPNKIIFLEVVKPERLVFRHNSDKENDPEEFLSTITFEEENGKTKVTMSSLFPSVEQRQLVIEKYGAIEGGNQTLGRLDAYVTQM